MKKIASIVLCMLLMASTSGIAYAQHFCGDFEMLATLTLGEEQLTCGMAVDDGCADESTKEHSCCANQYTKVNTDDSFNSSEFDVQLPVHFVKAFVSVFVLQSNFEVATEKIFYSEYNPPPLIKDIPVLYETFLI